MSRDRTFRNRPGSPINRVLTSPVTANVSVSGTTNSTLTGLSLTIPADGTAVDVWLVLLQADVNPSSAGGFLLGELLLDGSVYGATIALANFTANTGRFTAQAHFVVTGMSSATHTITARARMLAAGQTATISGAASASPSYATAIRLL